jgi:hypothetical protein
VLLIQKIHHPTFQYLFNSPGYVTTQPHRSSGGEKMRGTGILPAATRAGGRKNTKIYIIKRAKDVEREAQ